MRVLGTMEIGVCFDLLMVETPGHKSGQDLDQHFSNQVIWKLMLKTIYGQGQEIMLGVMAAV